MYRILFVCSGNIIRSPIAEFLFKKQLNEQYGDQWKSKLQVDSGAVTYKNTSLSNLATQALLDNGIAKQKLKQFKPRHIDDYPDLFDQANLILVMTKDHLKQLETYDLTLKSKAKLLTSFMNRKSNIPDPYFSNNRQKTLKLAVELINTSLDGLLEELRAKNIITN